MTLTQNRPGPGLTQMGVTLVPVPIHRDTGLGVGMENVDVSVQPMPTLKTQPRAPSRCREHCARV